MLIRNILYLLAPKYSEMMARPFCNCSHVEQLRQKLHDVWEDRGHKEQIHLTGSGAGKIGGPTYAMALYLKMFENYKDR